MQTMSRIVISTSTDIIISLVVIFFYVIIHLNYQHISAQANMLCKNARVSLVLLAGCSASSSDNKLATEKW